MLKVIFGLKYILSAMLASGFLPVLLVVSAGLLLVWLLLRGLL